jgi:antirestriction protein ArdC
MFVFHANFPLLYQFFVLHTLKEIILSQLKIRIMDSQNTPSTKIDVYQLITDQIIALLEQGVIPWQKPWADAGIPMNLLSKRQYRGINLWLLLSLNYEKNCFLTWEQIKSIGGSVKQGEHGHIVVFWKPVQKKTEEQTDEKQQSSPMLRYYKVFNIAQCRNIPEHLVPAVEPSINEFEPIEQCDAIIVNMPNCPVIQHKEQRAYYQPDTDIINMPKKKSFKSIDGYYSTLFHELVHSTGSEKRLGRKTLKDMVPFGSESYAQEELVAEMGSTYLCRFSGILPNQITNAVAYLDNWLGVFKKDKRFLITAAGQAQRAADFIFGITPLELKEESDIVKSL